MTQALERFAKQRPASPWRLKALLAIAEPLMHKNDQAAYEPLYRACADAFPKDPQARQGAKLPVRPKGIRISIAVIAEC